MPNTQVKYLIDKQTFEESTKSFTKKYKKLGQKVSEVDKLVNDVNKGKEIEGFGVYKTTIKGTKYQIYLYFYVFSLHPINGVLFKDLSPDDKNKFLNKELKVDSRLTKHQHNLLVAKHMSNKALGGLGKVATSPFLATSMLLGMI